MTRGLPIPTRAGIGLRLPHILDVAVTRPPAAWLEVHPENVLGNPHALAILDDLAIDYPLSLHTVGVSVGSAHGVDLRHLTRVRDLVDRFEPALVSGHLAWSTHPGEYLNDLLPLPYDDDALARLTAHVDLVQSVFARPFLVENPSTYLGFSGSTLTEAQFLGELAHRTGCRLLCDISNIYLSGHNMGFDPRQYIEEFPATAVAEFHLGGFVVESDDDGTVLIDTHSTRIQTEAWRLYVYAVSRMGPRPTLIEWDQDLPPIATLLEEAHTADALALRASARHVDATR